MRAFGEKGIRNKKAWKSEPALSEYVCRCVCVCVKYRCRPCVLDAAGDTKTNQAAQPPNLKA